MPFLSSLWNQTIQRMFCCKLSFILPSSLLSAPPLFEFDQTWINFQILRFCTIPGFPKTSQDHFWLFPMFWFQQTKRVRFWIFMWNPDNFIYTHRQPCCKLLFLWFMLLAKLFRLNSKWRKCCGADFQPNGNREIHK